MSDEIKKDEQAPEVKTELSGESLPESELEKVAGGVYNVMQYCAGSAGTDTNLPNNTGACKTQRPLARLAHEAAE